MVSRGTPVSTRGKQPIGDGRRLRLDARRRRVRPGLVERLLQLRLEVVERVLGFLDADVAPLHQRLGVELAHRSLRLDALVHDRLRVARVVALVVTETAVADHVDHDVFAEALAVLERQPGDADARLGIVAVHVQDRRLHHLGNVGRVLRGTGRLGRRGETQLVVDDEMDRAADAVALDHPELQCLGDDALPGEGGVAVHEQRQDRERSRIVDQILLGPRHAHHNRVDGLEMTRVGRELDLDLLPGAGHELAGLTEVVLHIARALGRLGVDRALELLEDLVVALADDVGEHIEPTAVRHAHDHTVEVRVRGLLDDGVECGDGGFGTLHAETLLTDVLRREKSLECLCCVEPVEDVPLIFRRQLVVHPFDLLLDPVLLVELLDVHVLDTDRAAIRITQQAQDVAELHPLGSGQAVRQELALEVPDREPVRCRVELVEHVRLFGRQWVEIGDQVPAHAVHADERVDRHLLLEHGLVAVDRVDVAAPLHGFVRHAQRAEHVVVEPVGAEEQLVHPLQEQPRLGALDDAVVVRRREHEHLRHAELGERRGIGPLIRRRIVEGADADDRALARHQARHRLNGADRAGVGEADGGAGEVVGRDLVRAHLADELFVRAPERTEVERVRISDHRDEQRARAVALLEVDGDAEPDVLVAHDAGRRRRP